MQWFKFYGQDYLSDPKMLQMTASERSCWITLLSFASINDIGTVDFLTEEHLMMQSGIRFNTEEWEKTSGILKKLQRYGMITHDNGLITILNWGKRQGNGLTNYQRVKRYRERRRQDNGVTEDDNAMITQEENRIEENIIYTDKIITKMYKYSKTDEYGNPLKSRLSRIDKQTNDTLISVGFMWQDMASKSLGIKKQDVVMLNLYYPIRKTYDREKWGVEDFQALFKYFFLDQNIKFEDKLSFDLCLSQKYIAKYKLAQKKRATNQTNVSLSSEIKL